VISVAAPAATASASTQRACGTFVDGPEAIVEERQSGGNLIIELTRAVVFSGTYTGGDRAYQRLVIHQDGSANVQMTITFSSLVCGQPAGHQFLVVGQVTFDKNFMGDIAGTYTSSTVAGRSRGRSEATASSRARRASAAATRERRTATDASKGEGYPAPRPSVREVVRAPASLPAGHRSRSRSPDRRLDLPRVVLHLLAVDVDGDRRLQLSERAHAGLVVARANAQ
jgi:hypothetical protein